MSKKRLWFFPKIGLAIGLIVVLGALFIQSNKPVSWPEALREQLGRPEYETVAPGKDIYEKKSIVQIGERRFAIPTVYIQTNLRGQEKQGGLNLLFVLPDFTARADFKNKEEYKAAFEARRFSHMLIQPASERPTIKQIVENRKKYNSLGEPDGVYFGLEKYAYLGNANRQIKKDDTYVERDKSGELVSILSCRPDDSVASPGCNHEFVNDDIFYNYYLNKQNYLPEWRQLQAGAINFINGFGIEEKV